MYWGREVPFYLQVAETLRRRIKDGEYQLGELLPTHRELEAVFNVSNITIRKALNLLTREGFLSSKKGVRAEIVKNEDDMLEIEFTSDFNRFKRLFLPPALGIKANILEIKIVTAPKRISDIINLNTETKVWRMKRVRKIKRQPISYIVNYTRQENMGTTGKKDIDQRGFIEVFKEVSKEKPFRMEQRVHAIMADMDLTKLLGVDYGNPLFFVEVIYFSKFEKAIAVTNAYLRGDRYKYQSVTDIP